MPLLCFSVSKHFYKDTNKFRTPCRQGAINMHQRINYAVDNTARNAAFLNSDDVSKDNERSEDGNLHRGNQGAVLCSR
ncbi:hypothetical protein NS381_19070 [Pantoea stewartii]|nr:hypothetical protein NS381_19070 [Pantoea stewartii]